MHRDENNWPAAGKQYARRHSKCVLSIFSIGQPVGEYYVINTSPKKQTAGDTIQFDDYNVKYAYKKA